MTHLLFSSTSRLLRIRTLFSTGIILASCVTINHPSICAAAWLVIARDPGPAVGVPGQPGAEFDRLDAPALNAAGRVAFHATLDSFSVSDRNTRSIWTVGGAQTELVVRQGDAAPGTSEDFQSFARDPIVNRAGQVLLDAEITGDTSRNDGLWLATPGDVQLLARTNVANSSPYQIQTISPASLSLSDLGSATFIGRADNSKSAIWHATTSGVQVVAMDDAPVPSSAGLPQGTTFGGFSTPTNTPVMSSGGTIAFKTNITGPGFSFFDSSIWTGAPGNLELLVREDAPAPGLPGVNFAIIDSEPVINDNGQTAFIARLSTGPREESIWLGSPGNLVMVEREGRPAPVGVAGVVFDDFDPQLRVSNSGHVGFVASVDGPGVNFSQNDEGIFVGSTGGVTMVARKGQQAPGMPAGAVFSRFDHLSVNDRGHALFGGATTGGGVAALENEGIWAQNSSGDLRLVARRGDWLHPDTGDVISLDDVTDETLLEGQGYQQISGLEIRSATLHEREYGPGWNGRRQVAFLASLRFPSLNEVMVLATVVPEPTSLALVTVSLCGVFTSCRLAMSSS